MPASRLPSLSRRKFLAFASLALLAPSLDLRTALAADEVWFQTTRDTDLWSTAKSGARPLVRVPQGTYLKSVGLREGDRLPVAHPSTGQKVYVDAAAIALSGPPDPTWSFGGAKPAPTVAAAPTAAPTTVPAVPTVQAAPAVPQAPSSGWVAAFKPVQLWTASEAGILLGEADPGSQFKLLEPQRGARLKVQDPLTSGLAFLDAKSVGPVGAPSGPTRVPGRWWGYVGSDDINVRSEPFGDSERLGTLARGTPVVVQAWVEGQEIYNDQPGWGMLGDGVYVYGPLLRKVMLETPPAIPAHGPLGDRWIDANLTQQTVTAYEGDRAVYMTYVSSGRPGWETHEGVHEILWRRERETMDSASLVGQDASRASYRIENIRWTQYFTSDGQAIHENFWRDPELFGIPSSHGCLGMSSQDALWFWLWAGEGTPLSVHS